MRGLGTAADHINHAGHRVACASVRECPPSDAKRLLRVRPLHRAAGANREMAGHMVRGLDRQAQQDAESCRCGGSDLAESRDSSGCKRAGSCCRPRRWPVVEHSDDRGGLAYLRAPDRWPTGPNRAPGRPSERSPREHGAAPRLGHHLAGRDRYRFRFRRTVRAPGTGSA